MENKPFHITTCPLCGCQGQVKIMTCTDRYATGERFDVLECPECHLRMTQDAPSEEVIGRYYEAPSYISHTDTHQGLMNRLYHLVRTYMLRRKVALLCRVSGLAKGSLLDIGTGTGYFPHHMRQAGWEVMAVEKSEKARRFAQEHLNLTVGDEGALAQLPAARFDAITLWHVMEHLQHLGETWNNLHTWLKDSGVLVVAVPNCASADAAHYGADWAAYDVPRHLWHFNPQVMERMALAHGFKLVEKHPMPFDAFYVSMLTEKQLGRNLSFVRGLLVGLCAWLKALGNENRSSSLIYVFKKKL